MRIILPPGTIAITGAASATAAGQAAGLAGAAGSPAIDSGAPSYKVASPREIAAAFAMRSPRPGTFVHLPLFHIRRARDSDWLAITHATTPQDVAKRLQEIEAAFPTLLRRIVRLCDAAGHVPLSNGQIATLISQQRTISLAIKLLVQKNPSPVHRAFEHNFIGKQHSVRMALEELSLGISPESISTLREVIQELLVLSSSYEVWLKKLISYSSTGLGVVLQQPPLHFIIARRDHQAKMQDIIWNLLRNAGQHPQDGQNEVTVRVNLDGNRFQFKDNGSGMTPQVLANLRAGIRLHNGERVESGEHGIGLQSVRRMAEEMGIQLEIDSTLGDGSTFTLILPEGFLKAMKVD